MKLSRPEYGEEMRLLRELYKKQDWLFDKEIAFDELISSCSNQNEKIMLFELLEKFVYLDSEKYRYRCGKIAEQILSGWKLTPSKTQIIGVTFDKNEPKSSDMVMYALKLYFGKKEIKDLAYSPTIGGSVDKAKERNHIVLVDDFIGTGKTVAHGITELEKYLANASVTSYNIYVASIAAMDEGKSKINKEFNVKFYSSMNLLKGLSDHFSGNDLVDKINQMQRLESLLLNKIGSTDLPSLGYGKSESLFSNESGNTPNNVFPIFWWKYFSDGNERSTLLERAGY